MCSYYIEINLNFSRNPRKNKSSKDHMKCFNVSSEAKTYWKPTKILNPFNQLLIFAQFCLTCPSCDFINHENPQNNVQRSENPIQFFKILLFKATLPNLPPSPFSLKKVNFLHHCVKSFLEHQISSNPCNLLIIQLKLIIWHQQPYLCVVMVGKGRLL